MFSTEPVRDPFWPVGFEGERYPISVEPRFKTSEPEPKALEPEVTVVDEAEASDAPGAEQWAKALKRLRFGGSVKMKNGPVAVLINGRARADGDFVRMDCDGYRFIWRVRAGEVARKLELDRVKAVKLSQLKKENK